MNEIQEILNLSNDDMNEGLKMIKEIGHSFTFSMNRYECRYGPAGDSHEHTIPEDVYLQANREYYIRSQQMLYAKAMAKKDKAKHDRISAKIADAIKNNLPDYEIEDLKADLEIQEQHIIESMARAKELAAHLEEFKKIRDELKPWFDQKYPGGLEQAQPVIKEAQTRYRVGLRNSGIDVNLNHIPLDPVTKAKLGVELKAPELTLWLAALEPEALRAVGGDMKKLIELRDAQMKLLDEKEKQASNT